MVEVRHVEIDVLADDFVEITADVVFADGTVRGFKVDVEPLSDLYQQARLLVAAVGDRVLSQVKTWVDNDV